jgi:hypothetical protein
MYVRLQYEEENPDAVKEKGGKRKKAAVKEEAGSDEGELSERIVFYFTLKTMCFMVSFMLFNGFLAVIYVHTNTHSHTRARMHTCTEEEGAGKGRKKKKKNTHTYIYTTGLIHACRLLQKKRALARDIRRRKPHTHTYRQLDTHSRTYIHTLIHACRLLQRKRALARDIRRRKPHTHTHIDNLIHIHAHTYTHTHTHTRMHTFTEEEGAGKGRKKKKQKKEKDPNAPKSAKTAYSEYSLFVYMSACIAYIHTYIRPDTPLQCTSLLRTHTYIHRHVHTHYFSVLLGGSTHQT